MLELLDEERTLGAWAHNRHVAFQHVPELRPLVEVALTQPQPDARRARVVLIGPDRSGVRFRIDRHRAELVNHELLAVEAHPLLLIKDRACSIALDEPRDDEHRHRHRDEGRRRDRDVERTFDDGIDALKRHVVEVDDRNAVKILEPGAQRDELQQVRDDLDVHTFAAG